PSRRRGSPFDYRQLASTDHSPLSASTLISSSSSSPGFEYNMIGDSMDPMETMKATSSVGQYEPTFPAGSPDSRRIGIEPPNFRMHLAGFGDDLATKNH